MAVYLDSELTSLFKPNFFELQQFFSNTKIFGSFTEVLGGHMLASRENMCQRAAKDCPETNFKEGNLQYISTNSFFAHTYMLSHNFFDAHLFHVPFFSPITFWLINQFHVVRFLNSSIFQQIQNRYYAVAS